MHEEKYDSIRGAVDGDWILFDVEDPHAYPMVFKRWVDLTEFLAGFAGDCVAYSEDIDLSYLTDFMAFRVANTVNQEEIADNPEILRRCEKVFSDASDDLSKCEELREEREKKERRDKYLELREEFENESGDWMLLFSEDYADEDPYYEITEVGDLDKVTKSLASSISYDDGQLANFKMVRIHSVEEAAEVIDSHILERLAAEERDRRNAEEAERQLRYEANNRQSRIDQYRRLRDEFGDSVI